MGGSAVFVVKRGPDLLRFLVFLVVVASLVWYVVGRFGEWRAAEGAPPPGSSPGTALVDGERPQAEPAAAGDRRIGAPAPEGPGEAEPAAAQTGEGSDYFAEFRIERERTRGALGDRLKEIMASPGAAEEVKAAAAAQYLELGQRAALESQAEAMVKARGFSDVVVHLSQGSAQVVVKAASLTQQEVAQVIDTVSRITGVRATAITVMARAQ
ncbi:stage III sporulation protein AH [Symbiobacterium terraclitae]|uniref:Stage III sporulation protein AH n=1 Tax=Symbiobacterium terraclitae TaxID=557451 RepID=A0ABS4JNX3_9FIRM|nr:SpoIIIAH-like family protein [Symbiobacterium terraclitae]MBP2016680.1 stage III sporulation protein AH [Symbiobacterium terraclitae]